MEKPSSSSGKPATRFGFDFSWADEVEREEREQEQMAMEQQRQEAKKEHQIRPDPFGAARPREVVLAEKGVDWRARDREFDATRGRPRLVANSAALAPATATAATSRARTVATPAFARRSTPARAAYGLGSGRTPGPRRCDAESTPLAKDPPPVSRSAWGGGKRNCAGEVPALAPATARRVQEVDGKGRRVFGELNVCEGCGPSFRSAFKKSCNSGRVEIAGSKACEGSRGCSATAMAATATEDQSAVGKKRKGRKRGKGGGSKKTKNQQALLL